METGVFVGGEAGEGYQRLFAALPLPALVIDRLGFIRMANGQASEYLGLSTTAWLQRRSLMGMLSAADRKKLMWRLADSTGQDVFEMRSVQLQLATAHVRPCDLHLVHLGSALTLEPMSLVVLVDRGLESEFQSNQERLREQTSRLADAIWASQSGFWEWHLPTDVLQLDDRFAQILGHARDGLRHLDAIGVSDLIHPDDRPRVRDLINGLTPEREPTFNVRVRMAHHDGGWVWVRNRGRVLDWDDHDRPLRLGGAIHDISQEVEREDALRAAKEQAEASERMKSEWLANVGHEVRTPLNSVLGIVQLMQERAADDVQREYLRQVAESAEVLRQTLDDLLDNAKLEAGKLVIESLSIDMAEFTRSIMAVFGHEARAKGLTLSCELNSAVPLILEGDPLRLRQVVTNLVSNALKFTSQGSVEVMFTGQHDPALEHFRLHVTVTDTGLGIAPSARERLFTPFYQADASATRRYGGSGLGLSICRRLVQLMGGAIGVDSTPGAGSRFWFQVPMKLGPAPARDPNASRHALRLSTRLPDAVRAQTERAQVGASSEAPSSPSESTAVPLNPLLSALERSLLLHEPHARHICESMWDTHDAEFRALLVQIHKWIGDVEFDAAIRALADWKAKRL